MEKTLENWEYYSPVKVKFGIGIFDHIGALITSFNAKSVAIICDPSLKNIGQKIQNENMFTDVESNPSLNNAQNALNFVRSCKADLIIGIGGGSALDVAKSAAILATHEGTVEEYTSKKRVIDHASLPLITVPTTAGTGAEITMWAVLWNKMNGEKLSLSHPFMFPTLALIDPKLTYTMPKQVLASTGLDALSHSFEAFWSKCSNPLADGYAIKAIQLIIENLPLSFEGDSNAKNNMSQASLLAGLAMSSVKTNSVHSMSYYLTKKYNVAHGAACALFLAEFLEFNFDYLGEKKVLLNAALQGKTGKEHAQKLKTLLNSVQIPSRLKDYNIPKEELNKIADEGFIPFRMAQNPREVTKADITKMLERLY